MTSVGTQNDLPSLKGTSQLGTALIEEQGSYNQYIPSQMQHKTLCNHQYSKKKKKFSSSLGNYDAQLKMKGK